MAKIFTREIPPGFDIAPDTEAEDQMLRKISHIDGSPLEHYGYGRFEWNRLKFMGAYFLQQPFKEPSDATD